MSAQGPVRRATSLTALLVVALLAAACGGGGNGAAAAVSVTGTDDLRFQPERLSVTPGQVTIELTAEDAAEHTFVIEDLGDQQIAAADPGATSTGSVELDAGTYTFYCDVPGHRNAGMEGILEVG